MSAFCVSALAAPAPRSHVSTPRPPSRVFDLLAPAMSALSFMTARCVMPARRMATRSAGRTTVVTKAGKCGCGKTDDKDGNCDGSHAKKMCGCGATASAKGFCDGSHAKLCKCGKTADPKKLCDGSHAK